MTEAARGALFGMFCVVLLVGVSLVVLGIGWALVGWLGEAGFLVLFFVLALALGAFLGAAPWWPPR